MRGNTNVVVLASSTANDQLVQFPVALKNVTLTSQSGNMVTLFSTPVSTEFIHLNGNVEPMATVSIPQDTYTSAAAAYDGTAPVCLGLQSPSTAFFIDGAINGPGTPSVTVNLPAPIKVTGTAMGLVLNLQVSESAPFSGGCVQGFSLPIAVSPVFDLTPMVIAAQPTNSVNGKALGLEGAIASIAETGSGFTVTSLYGYFNGNPPTWQVSTNGSTVFQGISGVSGLSTGMPVDIDVALQADGSLMATRVAVYNTDAANLSLSSGQVILANPPQSSVWGLTAQTEGGLSELYDVFGYENATSQISGQFTNLQNLPFVATFNAANTVAGENVLVTSNAVSVDGLPPLPLPLATMALMPQTINGTVSAISTSGDFTTYTVTLAPYDPFAELAGSPGQPALTSPNTVVVYADSNAQMLSSSSVSVGGVFRFYGLVFNNNGTLSMDCAQVNDGVAE
ncbi:MAG: DUF5666 domain-containing protein [Candidatus Sulfotelmatobacter sp.]